jgi:hypothetical protein
VFTGSGRRRAWAAQQNAQIVAKTHASGETASAAARRHGLPPQAVVRMAPRWTAGPSENRGLGWICLVRFWNRLDQGAFRADQRGKATDRITARVLVDGTDRSALYPIEVARPTATS